MLVLVLVLVPNKVNKIPVAIIRTYSRAEIGVNDLKLLYVCMYKRHCRYYCVHNAATLRGFQGES